MARMASDPRWREFVRRHRSHPATTEDVIYALPSKLITELQKEPTLGRRRATFFSADEKRFELDLAELSGTGFFQKRPIRYFDFPRPAKLLPKSKKDQELDERHRRAHKSIEAMLLESRGPSDLTPEEEQKWKDKLAENLEQCRAGYAAWLVTEPRYCRARDVLRKRWSTEIDRIGRFPMFPISLVGESASSGPASNAALYGDFLEFFQHWGVETFATWELPVPMRAELLAPTLYDPTRLFSSGYVLFAPSFMIRANDVKLHELMRRSGDLPSHLRDWIEGRNPRKFGPDRLAIMLRLYVIIELAINRRYPGRLSEKKGRLDAATLAALGLRKSDDTIEKVRLAMQRRLCDVKSG